jgi:S-formylglutathione hydrolase FrmB
VLQVGRSAWGAVLGAAVLLALPSAAGAARIHTISAPSRYVDTRTATFPSGQPRPDKLQANVMLPSRYRRGRRYPVLYLLHGAGDNFSSWADPTRGYVADTLRGLNAIVVMPEGGLSFYTNWWNDGRRGDPAWERYHLNELIPQIEQRYKIRPHRRWHAIAGLSMGGYGSSHYAEVRPDYFGTVVPMSGFVAPTRLTASTGFPAVTGLDYEQVFGPRGSPYQLAHDPSRMTANLGNSRAMLYSGNGVPRPGVPASGANLISGIAEVELYAQNREFLEAARRSGVRVSMKSHLGVHDWPYWREDLRNAMDRGLFQPVAEHPRDWVYRTIEWGGRAWDLRFRFDAPPAAIVRFVRTGRLLRATGGGGATVTLKTDGGCTLTRQVPFERRLEPGC